MIVSELIKILQGANPDAKVQAGNETDALTYYEPVVNAIETNHLKTGQYTLNLQTGE